VKPAILHYFALTPLKIVDSIFEFTDPQHSTIYANSVSISRTELKSI